MNLNQAQQFILSWSKLGRKDYMKDPKQCEVYLKRLQYFLNLIGNPEKKIPHYIHVAGTSGKGSVCLMLDAILRADKKRVGTMTSPEIGPTQTRWQINGRVMSNIEFAKILTELKPKLDEYLKTSPYDPISHFELMTAIGLYWFAKKRVRYAILEVGCGGRYDSTNVIPYKDIAVITNIGLDHTDILGKTKAKIAYEKSGIIKPGCKVFTMEKDKKILEIIKKEMSLRANEVSEAIPCFIGIASSAKSLLAMTSTIFTYKNQTYSLSCLGQHQIKNAVLCIEIAKSLKIPYSTIKRGLGKVKLPLRMEIVSKNPLIILDGAHNPDKMKTTVKTMYELRNITKLRTTNNINNHSTIQLFNHLHLLVGFSADKNIKTMCHQLSSLNPTSIAITKFHSHFKKSAEPKNIQKIFKKYSKNIQIKTFNNPFSAFTWSKKQQKTGDLLLATGSIYLSGELSTLF